MAATYDITAGVQSVQHDGGTTSFSLSITPSSAGSAVFCAIAAEQSFGIGVPVPTCGGVTMVEVGTRRTVNSVWARVFRLENQGASAVAVAGDFGAGPWGAGNSPWEVDVWAVNGADTTNCVNATANSGAGAASLAMTAATGNLIISLDWSNGDGTGTPQGGTCSPGTMRSDHYFVATPGTDDCWQAFQTVGGNGASQAMGFTPANPTTHNVICNIDVLAAAGGGGGGDTTPDPFVTVLFTSAV